MPSLKLHSEITDLSLDEFLTGIVGIFLSPFEIVTHIFWAQQVGQAKRIRKKEYSVLDSCLIIIQDNLSVIESELIRKHARKIDEALTNFIELSRNLIVWEDTHVSSYAKRKHRRLTLDLGSFEISPWVSHPDYQGKLKLITKLVSIYHETLVRLVSHIEPMITDSNSESLINQIARFKQQIPDFRLILNFGIQESLKIKASKLSK